MERRKQTRVQLPLEIYLSHPLIGKKILAARDLSEDGLFVWFANAPFKVGSTIDVTLRRPAMIESRPTPTIKMQVLRVEESGIALGFSNKSGVHLWRHALPNTHELEIGKDLFRVFQAAIIRDPTGNLLTVQQNGRWLFPGIYLQTGQPWLEALQDYVSSTLNLTDTRFERTVHMHCDSEVVALEGTTMSIFQLFSIPTHERLQAHSPYTKASWLSRERQLDALSFSAEPLRELARSLLLGNAEHSSQPNAPALPKQAAARENLPRHPTPHRKDG